MVAQVPEFCADAPDVAHIALGQSALDGLRLAPDPEMSGADAKSRAMDVLTA